MNDIETEEEYRKRVTIFCWTRSRKAVRLFINKISLLSNEEAMFGLQIYKQRFGAMAFLIKRGAY